MLCKPNWSFSVVNFHYRALCPGFLCNWKMGPVVFVLICLSQAQITGPQLAFLHRWRQGGWAPLCHSPSRGTHLLHWNLTVLFFILKIEVKTWEQQTWNGSGLSNDFALSQSSTKISPVSSDRSPVGRTKDHKLMNSNLPWTSCSPTQVSALRDNTSLNSKQKPAIRLLLLKTNKDKPTRTL